MERIGRYKIIRELGRGAMGVVYHAIDPNIGRPVAIKTIDLGTVRNAEEQKRLRDRLFREARSAGILSHPGIVTIYDVEQQDDLAYIAMEYVDGPTLDQLLSGPEPLAGTQMFSILSQTATALDYAHQKGIVHRDIKPANIMIAGDGTVKITDFGIAKVTASDQFTMTGSIVGTPHYMSPEQVQGQPVDGKSDQFSLAVVAYEMLTGEKPYTGEHLTTVVYKIVADEPAAAHRLNASLSAGIENVLREGLAKNPDGRFGTCSEFVGALEKACAATKGWKPMLRGGSLNEPTIGQIPPAPRPVGPAISLPPPRRPRRSEETATVERAGRRKSSFMPFLLAILMAGALLALIGWQAGPWAGTENPPENSAAKPQALPQTSPSVQPSPAATPTQDATKPSPMPAPPGTEPKAAGSGAAPTQTTAENPSGAVASGGAPAAQKETGAPVPKLFPSRPSFAGSDRGRPESRLLSQTQPVTIISSPGGATATLDGRPDTACTTPCSIDAQQGRHTVAITMPGYQVEHRQVDVGRDPIELPAVLLREPSGTLMVSSAPPGASISVNGQKSPQTTPAQLRLPPGSYKITVEKDGQQSISAVEIRNGETKLLKVTLQ